MPNMRKKYFKNKVPCLHIVYTVFCKIPVLVNDFNNCSVTGEISKKKNTWLYLMIYVALSHHFDFVHNI